MKVNFVQIVCFLCFISIPVLANTNINSNKKVERAEKTVLTVALEEQGYYPYYYQKNGDMSGFSVDVINYIEANSKYDFEFVILPWPRALHLVSQGEIDLVLTLFKTPQREKVYHFIEPAYGVEVSQLFALSEFELNYNGNLKQLTPYSIGTLREYSYGEYFDQANYLKKLPVLTEDVLLKLLLAERTDFVISNSLVFKQLILERKLQSKVKPIEPYISITPVHMALTKARKDAHEIKKITEQLTLQLKNSPYYQELLNKYQLNF